MKHCLNIMLVQFWVNFSGATSRVVSFILFYFLTFYGEFSVQALIEKTKLNPSEVGDIVVGTVLARGSLRAMECRMAAFYAGFPGIIFILHAPCMDV